MALTLSTNDPRHSPRLKRVSIHSADVDADWTSKVRVRSLHNETITRTSIPFEYEAFDQPRLRALRQQYKLDEVVKGARTELQLIERLAAWSSKQWDKGHLGKIYPAWDALEILKPYEDGKPVGGFCQQYNLVFLQACECFGLVGRPVSIGPGVHADKIRGGHEVVEIWSNEHKKWIYVDGNTAWYAVDARTNVPLSLRELRARQLESLKGKSPTGIKVIELAKTRHEWKGLDAWPPFVQLRLVPRSNFLAKKTPVPLHQGMRGWFWTGHHVWTDDLTPMPMLYKHHVRQPGNWDWTLNQAHFTLEAGKTPGVVRVHLDTETPGFDQFRAVIDGTEEQRVRSGFAWKLHPGKNRLEVWPRNGAGRAGVKSWIELEYK